MWTASAAEQLRCAEDINAWLSEGGLRASIDRVLPQAKLPEAHQLQEENTLQSRGVLKGKIVMKP